MVDLQIAPDPQATTSNAQKDFKGIEEFKDKQVRDKLAQEICIAIDSYTSEMADPVADWQYVQDIYDDVQVPSSLTFIEDLKPYNISLLSSRVDGMASNVGGSIADASPKYILKGFGTDKRMSDAEKDLDYMLSVAGYAPRVREAAFSAVMKSRGFLRVRYQTTRADYLPEQPSEVIMGDSQFSADDANESGETQGQPNSSDIPEPDDDEAMALRGMASYSGIVIESIKPENMIVYPRYSESLETARIVGHMFERRTQDIRSLQAVGRYFDDVTVIGGDETPTIEATGSSSSGSTLDASGSSTSGSNVPFPDDGGKKCYDVIVKVIPKGKEHEVRYRATVLYTTRQLLDLEPYRLPTVNYFAPALRTKPQQFFSRSVAQRLIEAQTIFNDAFTLLIFGNAAASFTTVAVSGYVGDQQTMKYGIGQFVMFRGQPSFVVIPTYFKPEGLQMLLQGIERIADALARQSEASAGGEMHAGTTATEAAGVFAGQAESIGDSVKTFSIEMDRLGSFVLWLMSENYRAMKAFHAEAILVSDPAIYKQRMMVMTNGQTPNNSPSIQAQKINAFLQMCSTVGIKVLPGNKYVDGGAAAEAILNSLDLNVVTTEIMLDIPDGTPPQPPPTKPLSESIQMPIDKLEMIIPGITRAILEAEGMQLPPPPPAVPALPGQGVQPDAAAGNVTAPGAGAPEGAPGAAQTGGPPEGLPPELLQAMLAGLAARMHGLNPGGAPGVGSPTNGHIGPPEPMVGPGPGAGPRPTP